MHKINELNKIFKSKSFIVSSTAYNDLLGHARGLARNIDKKDSQIAEFKDQVRRLKKSAETSSENRKRKYKNSVLRDPKTGLFLKGK